MRRYLFTSRSVFIGSTLCLLTGCGWGSVGDPTVYPVHGKVVTAAGQPLSGATVHLEPEGLGRPGDARLNKDGTFSIGSVVVGKEGATPGKYKVWIEAEGRTAVPQKYQAAETSGLVVEVKAEDNNLEPFKLEGAVMAAAPAGRPTFGNQSTSAARPAASPRATQTGQRPAPVVNDNSGG